jgi:small-conductance mechanosensitive channel
MGEIGQTLIIVFSLIIGMVVSMAATGSIGNLLSGIVIMAFKPFEEGDWVIIADKHTGQIIEMNIMFTKIRDLENEIIEIPNNLVLSTGIINWTMAGKKGGFAIEIDASIGYSVPAKQVIQLMKDSCVGIPNLLEFPRPNVIISEFRDFAIAYKLRAYIQAPQVRFKTQTEIMINMQKTFTEAGVEIMSPEYNIQRAQRMQSAKSIKGRMKDFNKFESTTPPTLLKKV